jgi:hypothetical protein
MKHAPLPRHKELVEKLKELHTKFLEVYPEDKDIIEKHVRVHCYAYPKGDYAFDVSTTCYMPDFDSVYTCVCLPYVADNYIIRHLASQILAELKTKIKAKKIEDRTYDLTVAARRRLR